MTNLEPAEPQGVDYQRIVRQLGLMTAVLALLGGTLGWIFNQTSGLLGGLMGALLTGLFFATTAWVMHLGHRQGPEAQIRNLVISWFGKLVLLFAAFIALEQAKWMHLKTFGLTVLVGVLGSLFIESRAVMTARIPADPPGGLG